MSAAYSTAQFEAQRLEIACLEREIERLQLRVNQLETECGHREADLAEAKGEIERLRVLLRLACNSEEAFWADVEIRYPGTEPVYESWYEAAKQAVGGKDE